MFNFVNFGGVMIAWILILTIVCFFFAMLFYVLSMISAGRPLTYFELRSASMNGNRWAGLARGCWDVAIAMAVAYMLLGILRFVF